MTEVSLGRFADAAGPPAHTGADEFAGLLHDLGHQIMTVSLLADSLQADNELSAESRQRAELIVQEAGRALGMIADNAPAAATPAPAEVTQFIDVRVLAERITRLAGDTYDATVRLQPGPQAYMQVNPMLAWRVMANLVDNAALAAGPAGQVDISISRGTGTVIEVTDNGPGYGNSTAGRGLAVVRQLLAATGGRLNIDAGRGGTSVRATFGGQCDRILVPRARRAEPVIA